MLDIDPCPLPPEVMKRLRAAHHCFLGSGGHLIKIMGMLHAKQRWCWLVINGKPVRSLMWAEADEGDYDRLEVRLLELADYIFRQHE